MRPEQDEERVASTGHPDVEVRCNWRVDHESESRSPGVNQARAWRRGGLAGGGIVEGGKREELSTSGCHSAAGNSIMRIEVYDALIVQNLTGPVIRIATFADIPNRRPTEPWARR